MFGDMGDTWPMPWMTKSISKIHIDGVRIAWATDRHSLVLVMMRAAPTDYELRPDAVLVAER